MLKLKRIKIENFRGIRQPITIDFKKGDKFTSVAILGRNGTGKSSIADGWEWFNTHKIAALNREGVSAKDFCHRASDGSNVYVEVEFLHKEISTLKAAFNPSKITVPTVTEGFEKYQPYCAYPNYLRFTDLQDFVYKTKTEKYQYIAKYFGLEAFTKNQADLLAFVNRLRAKQELEEKVYSDSKSTIVKLLGKQDFAEEDVIASMQQIGKRHGIAGISTFSESKRLKSRLGEAINNNPRTKELLAWKELQKKGRQLYPIKSPENDILRMEALFDELRSDADHIAKLALLGLYDKSVEVLSNQSDTSQCPLCDSPFAGDLLEHVKDKHVRLKGLAEKKSEFERLKTNLHSFFTTLSTKATNFTCDLEDSSEAEYNMLVVDLTQVIREIPEVRTILQKGITEIDALGISKLSLIETTKRVINSQNWFEGIVQKHIDELSSDQASSDLAADHELVLGLRTHYYNFLLSDKRRSHIRKLVQDGEQILERLTSFLQDTINRMFGEIATDVAEYFNELEQSHTIFKNPFLRLVAGKEKAVELEIEFGTEVVTPAYKVLSESQINSFGLSIFLASVKHFNCDFKFFVLDDVVNSFDSYKRPRVASLLQSKFRDFQVLLLTHDEVFFDTLKRRLQDWNSIHFTDWSYHTGPSYRIARSLTSEVQEALDIDKPTDAGMKLGRYLEWTLGELCENLKVAIPYKRSGDYTLADFYAPFSKKAKECVKDGQKVHQLQTLLEELDNQTIFRNYCVHWKGESSSFSRDEIQDVLNGWMKIERLVYSEACGSFVRVQEIGNRKILVCKCATVRLSDDAYYLQQAN